MTIHDDSHHYYDFTHFSLHLHSTHSRSQPGITKQNNNNLAELHGKYDITDNHAETKASSLSYRDELGVYL